MSSSTRIAREIRDGYWSINVAGKVYGPYTGEQISGFVKEGRVAPHSVVRPGEAGPWITAIDDPFLMQLFVAETPRELRQPVASVQAGSGVAATPAADDAVRAEPQEETNLVIVAEVRAGSPALIGLDAAIRALGAFYRLTHNAWILRSRLSAGAVRNELTRQLGGSDRLFVADARNSKTAWFNLAADADIQIGKVWSRNT